MTVPKLDLAPKRERPLSLWNPLDYLLLLYWVFFFPQAIRWYVETFGKSQYKPTEKDRESIGWRQLWAILRSDPIQRLLVIQGLLLTVLISVGITALLQWGGIPVSWFGLGLGIVLVIAASMALDTGKDVAQKIVITMVFGMGLGVVVGGAQGMNTVFRVEFFSPLIVIAILGATLQITMANGVRFGLINLSTFGLLVSLGFGFLGSVVPNIRFGFLGGVLVISIVLFIARLLDYMICLVPNIWTWHQAGSDFVPKRLALFSRMPWIPFPGIRKQVTEWLSQDHKTAISNVNQLLAYTSQFIPVVEAVKDWLAGLKPNELLPAVNELADKPFDWNLLYVCSLSLKAIMLDFVLLRFLISERLRKRWVNVELALDTPARAACAGYWSLHMEMKPQATKESFRADNLMQKSCKAFKQLRHLAYGETLYQSVLALSQAQESQDFDSIADWQRMTAWLTRLKPQSTSEEPTPDSILRAKAIATLERLRKVSLEATVAQESVSRYNRSAAINRALGQLTLLIEEVEESCPYPEWPIVKEIAQQWRDILGQAAGEIGEIAITEPVENPFVVGNPVQGSLFVGREDIFREIEELWGSDATKVCDSVILYGHRRMGKTSILQNLGQHRFGVDTIVAQFSMGGQVAHTGVLLSEFAFTIFDALEDAGLTDGLPEPDMDQYERNWNRTFKRFLRAVKKKIGQRRVILTIDEFEIIEREIEQGRIEKELLEFLRRVIQNQSWLLLALAGLHTLQEMTEDYWNPLFASVKSIRVSFLNKSAIIQLLANPTDDFPLDFTHATIDRVYELVQGQPYLTQLIGHSLVRLYNQSVFEAQEPREARFTPADIDTVVNNPAFYEQGSYYFRGVWQQAEQSEPNGQLDILRALAASDLPLEPAELSAQAGLSTNSGAAALETLRKHDVVSIKEGEGCRFTVPLMKRWVREHKSKEG